MNESYSVLSDSSWPHGLYSSWNSPGQNTGVGSLSFLQRIFPTQGLNPGLPHCRRILYQLSHKGSPIILEWVAYPFFSGSSWPRNGTRVSCIAGGFFTNWSIREPLSMASVQFSSVAQSCLTLCDPMDCSTPGLPVHHQLPELLKFMSIESVRPSNRLILCRPLLLLPSIFPSSRVFWYESFLRTRWPKYLSMVYLSGKILFLWLPKLPLQSTPRPEW